MRQHRLKPHRTIDFVVMTEPSKFARIMPPPQTHSYGHIQQGSQQQQMFAVQQEPGQVICNIIASITIVKFIIL
jgi:hypothetical protein